MLRSRLLVPLLLLALVPRAARANDAPGEPGRTALQLATATLLNAAMITGAFVVANTSGRDEIQFAGGGLIFAASPLAQGLAVCGIGGRSAHYRGGCGAPILGAYAGLAAGIGSYFLLSELFDGNDVPGAIAILALPPIGATLGWALTKEPIAVDAPAASRSLPRLQAAPGTTLVRVLAGAF